MDENKVKVKVDGVAMYIVARDYWQGPVEAGDKGTWERGFHLEW